MTADRPRLLDLFCGAGGAARGYQLAGFHVAGVDVAPQPRYAGDAFVRADALEYLAAHGREYDAVHASPPCQRFSKARHTPGSAGREYPDLLAPTLGALEALGRPWVVENVEGAPLPFPALLCGTLFGLPLRRHRLFAGSWLILAPATGCRHRDGDLTVFGHCVQVCGSRGAAYVARSGRMHYRPLRVTSSRGGEAMGIDWMTRGELSQAIPPAYTRHVGLQLLNVLGVSRAGD